MSVGGNEQILYVDAKNFAVVLSGKSVSNMSDLKTDTKASLIAAINELVGRVVTLEQKIDDVG